MKKSGILSMLVGVTLGTALFGGGTALASSGIMAPPSTQAINMDGERVNMTAYSIGGNNYVKLRDVGQAVNFSVTFFEWRAILPQRFAFGPKQRRF